jgi:argininosuccinate synthase
VLACAGELDTAVTIARLRDTHAAEVVAVLVAVGQDGDLEGLRARALAAGAAHARIVEARDEFAAGYILRVCRADAVGDQALPVAAPLPLPVVAEKVAAVAHAEQIRLVAHCLTGAAAAGFALWIRSIDPALHVLAPAGRSPNPSAAKAEVGPERRAFASAPVVPPAISSLWCRVVAHGERQPVPSEPAQVEITFVRGTPVAVNGVEMPLLDLIASVTVIAKVHGIGRAVLSNRSGSRRRSAVRLTQECPAAAVLHVAHADLQRAVTTPEAVEFSRTVTRQYASLVRSGQWFTMLREALDVFVDRLQERVTGTVRVRLHNGKCTVIARHSENALNTQTSAAANLDLDAGAPGALDPISTATPTIPELVRPMPLVGR